MTRHDALRHDLTVQMSVMTRNSSTDQVSKRKMDRQRQRRIRTIGPGTEEGTAVLGDSRHCRLRVVGQRLRGAADASGAAEACACA